MTAQRLIAFIELTTAKDVYETFSTLTDFDTVPLVWRYLVTRRIPTGRRPLMNLIEKINFARLRLNKKRACSKVGLKSFGVFFTQNLIYAFEIPIVFADFYSIRVDV